jgi:hypothetical protein
MCVCVCVCVCVWADRRQWLHSYMADRDAGIVVNQTKKKKKSVAWVRERTIQIERPPFVGEVSANILRIEGAT